jgi:DNA-binding IclR family transcriptional regulator
MSSTSVVRMPLNPSPSVMRAGELLDYLARHAPESYSVSEIARATSLPRATCDSILLALAEQDLVVRRDPDLRYTLGPACVTLGDAARGEHWLVAARRAAQDVARSTGSCVALVTRRGSEASVIDVFDHGPALGLKTAIGQTITLVPPFGAVFVAWADDDGRAEWLDHPTVTLSKRERARYRAALEAVRDRGYSVTVADVSHVDFHTAQTLLADTPDAVDVLRRRDELLREIVHTEYLPTTIDAESAVRVSQMSAPVFDRLGNVSGAIMMLGPPYDITAGEIAALGAPLRQAAEQATARVSGAPPTAAG